MPYIGGGDLKRIFDRFKSCSERVAKFYIAQIAIGVGKLHEAGIIHRDLKLANIMLEQNGYLKLIDFGLARRVDPGALAQTCIGTPCYVAPELLSTDGYSFGIDWWALGIILYEMVYGKRPFASSNPQ